MSAFCLSGCKDKGERELIKFFGRFTASITNEDIGAYMSCIDNGSAEIDTTVVRASMSGIFERYDLSATVEKLSILNISDDTANVNVTIRYENRGERPYVDNRVTGNYILIKKDGRWTITNSTIRSVEYLNGKSVSDGDATYTVPAEEASDEAADDLEDDHGEGYDISGAEAIDGAGNAVG